MKNVIEVGKAIRKDRAIKLIADIETYTYKNQVAIIAQSVYCYLHMIFRGILRLFGKDCKEFAVLKWDDRHSNIVEELERGHLGELQETMVASLEKAIHIPRRYRDNADRSASYLVNFAAKGYKRGMLDGLSIPEKVEYIYEKYPHMKEKNERKTIGKFKGENRADLDLCTVGISFDVAIPQCSCQ